MKVRQPARSSPKEQMTASTTLMTEHESHHDHTARYFDDEGGLLSLVSDYLADGAAAGDPLIVVATTTRLEKLTGLLRQRGIDTTRALASGHLVLLDAGETIDTFLRDAMPAERLFRRGLGRVVTETIERHGRARVYVEMVDILSRTGNPKAAARLEELLGELATRHGFSLFCAYESGHSFKQTGRPQFDALCADTTAVFHRSGSGG